MTDALGLIGDVSPAITTSWVIWTIWATAQLIWFRRVRALVPVPVKPSRKRTPRQSSGRRAAARRTTDDRASSLGVSDASPELLASLGIHDVGSNGATDYGVALDRRGQLPLGEGV